MDERSLAFVQQKAQEAVAGCFESGLSRENLLRSAVTELQFYDAIESSLKEAEPPAHAIACTEGCSACCHQRVACTIPQAIAIALALTTRSDAEIIEVARAARAQ